MNFETKTKLLSHQVDAVNKLLPTRIGGLFAEMGTGKTRMVIELVKLRQHKIDKVVYFCPVSLKETVRQQLFIHTNLTAEDIYVFDDKTNEQNIPEVSWYIIGIESMSSSSRVVMATNKLITENTYVILDESSYIKGHHSLRTMRITKISERARYRNILTGTPLSQGVVDLYSQMYFLSPKILGYNSFYSFAANHLEYSEKFPGMIVRAHNTEYLAAKIKPYVYQVTKEECLTLPKKLYETRYFWMSEEQARWYSYVKNTIFEEWEAANDPEFSSIMIFRLFSSLQQVVSGFWNERLDKIQCRKKREEKRWRFHEFDNPRLDVLRNIIQDIPKDDKVIIFCKFQYDLDSIRNVLAQEFGADSTAIFCGQLSEQERNNQIAKFRNEARFFVVNQASGGHGLTLNEAHYVIFYNNGFKYSERLQAEDRCIAKGQLVQTLVRGFVPIEDIKINDKVLTHTGKWQKVIDVSMREHRGLMTEIIYTRYNQPLLVTHDHKILIKRGNNDPIWVQAHQIIPGDFLVMPRPIVSEQIKYIRFPEHLRHNPYQANQFGSSQINGRYVHLPEMIELNDDLLYLFGWYLAEGCASIVNGKGRFISLSGHEKERHILERLGKQFDLINVKWTIYSNQANHSIELRAYSIELAYWFKEWFGSDCYDKKIPEILMNLCPEQTMPLLTGYIDGDGYKRNKQIEWVTTSNCLASQIGLLALKCGYSPTLRKIKDGKNANQWVGGYTINGNPSSDSLKKQDYLYVYQPVHEVRTFFAKRCPNKQMVYNLTIENDSSFVVGQAIVHNCHRIGQEYPVTYIDIECLNSIDERIAKALSKKGNAVAEFRREVEKVKKDRIRELIKAL